MFSKYHYLDAKHNNSARVFIATINDIICGFISVLTLPSKKRIRKVHRLVILPDYQGLSIGIKLLNLVGDIIISEGSKYYITTSQPSLMYGLKNYTQWKCVQFGRKAASKTDIIGKSGSCKRITTSWEYNNKNI